MLSRRRCARHHNQLDAGGATCSCIYLILSAPTRLVTILYENVLIQSVTGLCTNISHLLTVTMFHLASFSTCEISDALIKLSVPHGGYVPDIHMVSPATSYSNVRICSPAYTVQMVHGSNTMAPKLSAHFVDTAPEGSVMVIDAPPGQSQSFTISDRHPLLMETRH